MPGTPDVPRLDTHHMLRIFSLAHGPVAQEDPSGEFFANRYHEHADGAREIAAWMQRVREAGWTPKIVAERTDDALFVVGIALAPSPALEQQVSAIGDRLVAAESALASLAGNVEAVVGAVNRMMSGIVTPR